jgi:hypothetical protein
MPDLLEMYNPWDKVQHPQQAKQHFPTYLRDGVFQLKFYRLHMRYFVVVILVYSLIVDV